MEKLPNPGKLTLEQKICRKIKKSKNLWARYMQLIDDSCEEGWLFFSVGINEAYKGYQKESMNLRSQLMRCQINNERKDDSLDLKNCVRKTAERSSEKPSADRQKQI